MSSNKIGFQRVKIVVGPTRDHHLLSVSLINYIEEPPSDC